MSVISHYHGLVCVADWWMTVEYLSAATDSTSDSRNVAANITDRSGARNSHFATYKRQKTVL